jgi:hypothetical protein
MNYKQFKKIKSKQLKNERIQNLQFINEEEYMEYEYTKYRHERNQEIAKIIGNVLTAIPKLTKYIIVRLARNTKLYIIVNIINDIRKLDKSEGINIYLLSDAEEQELHLMYAKNRVTIPEDLYNQLLNESSLFETKTINDLIFEKLGATDNFTITYDGENINDVIRKSLKSETEIETENVIEDLEEIETLDETEIISKVYSIGGKKK